MMRVVKNWMKLFLKIVNLIIGIAGIVVILYSLQMIRVWQLDAEGLSFNYDNTSTFPWFIHAFVGIGITLCAITCLGHFAANTANAHCLSFYMAIVFLLLILETALLTNVFLNSEWEKDLPEDPLGRFDNFKDFVKSNNNICQCIGLLIILAQGFSILLAAVLRILATEYKSEDDYDQNRLPLLNPSSRALLYAVGEPYFPS